MKFPQWLRVYGDASYRGDCPKETAEQVTFFNVLRAQYPDSYGLIAIHPRNEGKRTHGQAWHHKAEGMTKGASDIIIPARMSFVCELKRLDHTKSKWEDGQLEYLEAAHNAGAFVCVALGWEPAMLALHDWINRQ
jgi:hypothetical protein